MRLLLFILPAFARLQAREQQILTESTPKLHGRFLHITGGYDLLTHSDPDFHPDPHYVVGSNARHACHRGRGEAGPFGAEQTDCDSPIALVNATFEWISQHIRDEIDFVVWTGDSARHDNDIRIPRTKQEIANLNSMLVDKFRQTFHHRVPIVPTFGNNDIMPHNIFRAGPTYWTKKFANIWADYIPETQAHTFERGGWFFVEVIPNRLAVFSLNTMYFFSSNSAVDGCVRKTEPGYEQMQWLRIQLEQLRQRGVKAIMTGHVPPARTANKQNWDESCWQLYTLWMHRYRDMVVGSLYGHMNLDHFMLQDYRQVRRSYRKGRPPQIQSDESVSIMSGKGYLKSLRRVFRDIPQISKRTSRKVGGPWYERYSLSLVAPSIVPNFFPTLRLIEYNVTGLESALSRLESGKTPSEDVLKHRKKRRKHKKVPLPLKPAKSLLPGPAYEPQAFSWTKFTQYFANISSSNHDQNFVFAVEYDTRSDTVYALPDLTVRSFVQLAQRIAQRTTPNRAWEAFYARAFVGTRQLRHSVFT